MIFKSNLLRHFSFWLLCLTSSLAGQETGNLDFSEVPPRMRVLDNEVRFEIGDRFNYQVLEEREEPALLFVDGQGEVKFPLAGRIPAIGRTPLELAVAVKAILEEDYFYEATVVIEPVNATGIRGRVNVIGEVRTNGMQPLPSDAAIRLSEMIIRSGGFTDEADRTEVRLIRQGGRGPNGERVDPGTFVYNVREMLETGNFDNDPYLVSEDLIMVPKREDMGGEFMVIGAVNREGVYPLTDEGITVSRAIMTAGNFSRFAQDRRVRLIRNDPESGEQETFTINVQDILEGRNQDADMQVRDGDIIRVDEKMINL